MAKMPGNVPEAPDVERLTAPNPGLMTLEGTNTYVIGRDPAVVIDPGPDDAGHIEAIREVTEGRGGIGAVLLTHGHSDHRGAVEALGVAPARPGDGETVAGLRAIATPGHAEDHLCFLLGRMCFSGDLVLGEGSSIVPTRELGGSLRDYMRSLRLLADLDLELIYPGHGPVVEEPAAKLAEYLTHREERQRRLEAALERGERSRAALVAEVWDDVQEQLRGAAAVAMQAHLEMLEEEDRLPGDLRD